MKAWRLALWLALTALPAPAATVAAAFALVEPGGRLSAPTLSPDGRYLAVRCDGPDGDPAVALLDVAAARPARRVSFGPEPLGNVVWLPPARLVAVTAGALWTLLPTAEPTRWPGVHGVVAAAAERWVAVAGEAGAVVVNPQTGAVAGRLAVTPTAMLLDSEGAAIVGASRRDGLWRLGRWDVASGALRSTAPCRAVTAMAWEAGEAAFWTGGANGLECRRTRDLALLRRLDTGPVSGFALSPDGSTVALNVGDRWRVVRLEDGSAVAEAPAGPGGACFLSPVRLVLADGECLKIVDLGDARASDG